MILLKETPQLKPKPNKKAKHKTTEIYWHDNLKKFL